jgi:hypothetical protein
MKARLLRQVGKIKKGATVDVGGKTGDNDKRAPDDSGGASTTSAPVYGITDKDGQTENVDTRDLKVVR